MATRFTKALSLIALLLVGCDAQPSKDLAEEAVRERIDRGQEARVRLVDFEKTDGQAAEMMGVPLYTMDFIAAAEFTDDAWFTTGGSIMQPEAHINTMSISDTPLTCRQNFAACVSQTPLKASRGDRLKLAGSVSFEKKESGWNVVAVSLSLPDGAELVTQDSAPGDQRDAATANRQPSSGVELSATSETTFRSTMQADLRNLASQQELSYAGRYSYSTDKRVLGFLESPGVTVTISSATARGWTASARHDGLPGETCSTSHGDEGDGRIECTAATTTASVSESCTQFAASRRPSATPPAREIVLWGNGSLGDNVSFIAVLPSHEVCVGTTTVHKISEYPEDWRVVVSAPHPPTGLRLLTLSSGDDRAAWVVHPDSARPLSTDLLAAHLYRPDGLRESIASVPNGFSPNGNSVAFVAANGGAGDNIPAFLISDWRTGRSQMIGLENLLERGPGGHPEIVGGHCFQLGTEFLGWTAPSSLEAKLFLWYYSGGLDRVPPQCVMPADSVAIVSMDILKSTTKRVR